MHSFPLPRPLKYFFDTPRLCEISLALLALAWGAFLFSMLYPIPLRDIGDEVWFIGAARSLLERGMAYRNIMFNDFDGGELRQMALIGQPQPLHQHLLTYHFPAYASYVAFFYKLTGGSMFWTVAITDTLPLIAVSLLTFALGLRMGLSRPWAWLAAALLTISPSITYFMSMVLPETLLVALALASMLLAHDAKTARQHLACALIMTLLVLTRYGFLTLVALITLWQIGKLLRQRPRRFLWMSFYLLPFALYFAIGMNGYLFYRPPAAKCVFSMAFYDMVLNTVDNLYYFWQGALLSSGPRALMANHQNYLYAGLIAVILSARYYQHQGLYAVAILGFFAALAGTIIFCSWWGWQHVRLSLWFMPFIYILVIALIVKLLHSRFFLLTPVVIAILLWDIGIDSWYTVAKMREEADNGKKAWTISQQTAAWIAPRAPEGSLVAIPLSCMAMTALVDPTRVYGVSERDTLPFWASVWRDTQSLPDLIVLKKGDLQKDLADARLDRFYRQQEGELVVQLPNEDKPRVFVALEKVKP